MPRHSNRKSISNKLRFDVFKRDQFACQYCGRKPPSVVLHIDHIIAVVDGGTNDEANLATSCDQCNNGKGSRPLTSLPKKQAINLERRMEQAKQLRMYNEFLLEERERENEIIERLGSYWFGMDHRPEFRFPDKETEGVRPFVQQLPETEIMRAIAITKRKMSCITSYAYVKNDSWKYFCAICWRMIRERTQGRDAHA